MTGEDRGSGWVNTSAESKTRVKERLAELESLLTETGSASLSKPAEILPDDVTIKTDTTVKKVEASSSPRGEMGQKYLVAGKRVSMRLWIDEPGDKLKSPTARREARFGRTNPEVEGWRFVARASGSDASVHNHQSIHGYRGNGTAGGSSRSRHTGLSNIVPAIESALGQ